MNPILNTLRNLKPCHPFAARDRKDPLCQGSGRSGKTLEGSDVGMTKISHSRRIVTPQAFKGSDKMIVGYARVSTGEQRLDLQVQALERMGCDRVFTDHGQSGSDFDRAGLEAAMNSLVAGDMLMVWRLDRLGRSLVGLVGLMDKLGKRGIHFRSLSENIDTASSGGKLMFHMMAALAEFERSLISERTRAGMAAAKLKGTLLGRPKALTRDQVLKARYAIDRMHRSPSKVAKELNVCKRTLDRHLHRLAATEAQQ